MKRALLAAVIGAVLLHAGTVRTSAQADALSFFKNYFITGDYVVGGVGLNGKGIGGVATDSIEIAGVPANTDIVAAFLYWQAVTNQNTPDAGSLGATFKGNPLSSVDGPFGKELGTGTPTCSSSGGGTGSARGSKRTFTYRAEVLRFFDVDDVVGSENYGKLIVNGPHQVQVPDGGGVEALGASLVVVYRDPTKELSAIVMYDGSYTMDQSTEGMSQTIQGFYDGGTSAKLTHIVGSGQLNKSEILRFNGTPVATNPFVSALGAQWDNPTFELTPDADLSQVTTSVDHEGFNSFDCLTWSAIVYRTTVNDTDGDGLLDIWESSTSTLFDPNGQALPNLHAMGADPDQKDLFVEIGYMEAADGTTYGGVPKAAHSHLPSHETLKLVGEAFLKAPTGAIKVHFDVGGDVTSYPSPPAGAPDYIIRTADARGGEAIDEMDTVCARGETDPPWVCQFSEYPGTVGWKSGFRYLRDELLDSNRKDMFHYAFFAHAIGLPKSEDQESPDFHVPRTNTGIGDFPGGDVMVTLGAFSDVSGLPVGTPFMQASTLMHELGHNMERRHGGEAREPNCKPTYLSVMNYLYQLRGLLDDAGKPHLDFSSAINPEIDEASLADGALQNMSYSYRLGWFAPLLGSYLEGRGTAAKSHCDGSPLAGEVDMVRIDARTAASEIDWNANGLAESNFAQDVNFNGRLDGDGLPFPALVGSDDWSSILLNQIGSRRNVGGLFVDPATGAFIVGPLSLDVGKGDLGKGDLGKGDLGKGDLGKGDLGKGDLGKGDLGKGDLGKGDLGKGDLGGGDLFDGDPDNPGGELDFETAGDLAKTPPNEFKACVIGVDCPTGDISPLHRVRLDWGTPNVGGVLQYVVYRVEGGSLELGQQWTPVGPAVTSVLGQTSYTLVDNAQLVNGALYTYFAVATYDDGIQSDPSNLVTITAVNDPPMAGDDSYATNEDTTLTVSASAGVLSNDDDPDTDSALTAVLVSGPSSGTLTLNADGSFAYTPVADYNGGDSFTYTANDGSVDSNVATVTINVIAVNDAPVAVNDSYSMDQGTALTIPAPGVLGNDTDIETPSSLTAAIASGPSHGVLTLNASGSFTYTPTSTFSGSDSFTYTASDGSATSAAATVSITVNPLYTFVGIQNVPPPSTKTFKAGSSIPMKWQYEDTGGAVVNSSQVTYNVKVTTQVGQTIDTITNTDPGGSSFRYSGGTWTFNLQTKDDFGVAYPAGQAYVVTIVPDTPGFAPSQPFLIILAK